jgi:hypothetical protein
MLRFAALREIVIMKILIALLLFFAAAGSPGAVVQAVREPTPTGTTLVHFNRVDEGVYKGSKPASDAHSSGSDYRSTFREARCEDTCHAAV